MKFLPIVVIDLEEFKSKIKDFKELVYWYKRTLNISAIS